MHDSWNADIFSCINNRLLNSAMKLLLAERNGESFDSQLVIGVRESYVSLCSPSNDKQIYKENFEIAYLTATESFYSTKSAEFLALNGVQQYMVWADQKLKEEEQRATKYLESSSFQALSETCVKVLVSSFKETILAECSSMIKNNETCKLNLMFRLVDRVHEGILPMLADLESFIKSQGLADMMACAEVITQDSEKYIEQLLDLFRRFSLLVKEAFNDDPRFLTARDKAFKQVVNDTSVFKLELPTKPKTATANGTTTTAANANSVNKIQPESRCPELLANYCDMLLRKTPLSRKLTSDEIELKLKEVLLVLKYVQNKDVFMRYHKAHLTRRLILDTSADNEKEENMVEWLRELGMPADYVNKLSRMFQDIKVSEDLNNLFKLEKAKSLQPEDAEMADQHNGSGSIPESINIKILNGGAWARGAERVPVSLPLDLEEIIPEIEEFYRKKHSGRKLQWHHHMSNGTIAFSNNVGNFDLDVTTFQMVVLFCWNERPYDKISFEDIKLATELPDIELRRTLWSLVCFPKLKRQIILCCSEVKSPKDFDHSSLFYINQEFTIM